MISMTWQGKMYVRLFNKVHREDSVYVEINNCLRPYLEFAYDLRRTFDRDETIQALRMIGNLQRLSIKEE